MRLLWYIKKVLFEGLKDTLKDTRLEWTAPTDMNKVSTWLIMHYENEIQVMVNQLVNEFYTWFLFNIDSLTQGDIFLLETAAIFFENWSPKVCEFLISEGL